MTFRWRSITAILFLSVCFCGLSARESRKGPPKPEVDPGAIINESYNLLREREPTMTESEYALYERIIPMVKLQPELALPLLEGMIGEEETSAAFDVALGNVYFDQQRFDEAEARYREAVRKFPDFRRGWDNLGTFYFSTGQFASAVPCFSRVVSLGGWEPRVFGLLGYCLAKSGNSMAAELAYSQAYAIESDNPDWIEGLVQVLLVSKQYSRVEPLLRQLTRIEPEDLDHWMLLANVLISQDRKIDAAVALDVAATLGILDTDGMRLLGDLYVDSGFLPEALEIYRQLAGKDPEVGLERLLRYARVMIGDGRLEEAATVLEDVEPEVDGNLRLEFLRTRASLLIARDEWAQARDVLEELLAIRPLDGPALLHLAEAQMNEGDEAGAAFTLETAVRVPEVAYMASLKLARLKVNAREFSSALALLDNALSLQSSPLVRDYRARVEALAGESR